MKLSRILLLMSVWAVQCAMSITPEWMKTVELPRAGRRTSVTTLPTIDEIYGYQPVLLVELPQLAEAAKLEIRVNGNMLPAVDALGFRRVRTPKNVRFISDGVYEIQAGKAGRTMELSLNSVLSSTSNNAIEIKETLGDADKALRSLLTKAKIIMRPEGESAAQQAPVISSDALTLIPGAGLNVLYHGKTLIYDDEMIGIGTLADLKVESHCIKNAQQQLTSENILVHHEVADFRREVAFDDNGALELTMRVVYKKDFPGNYEWYSFAVPVELLEGATWETRSGSAGGFDIKKGTFNLSAIPENGKVFTHAEIRFLHIEKGSLKLNFDFNPYGAGDWYSKVPYAGNPIGIVTHVNKVGKNVRFYITKRPHADRYAAKLRIYAGENDFNYRHYNNAATYYVGPFIGNPGLRLLFGTKESAEKRNSTLPASSRNSLFGMVSFKSIGKDVYVPMLAAGWSQCPENVSAYSAEELFPIASGVAAKGKAKAEFTIPSLPGVYSLQLTMGHPQLKQGPFTVSVNGEILADGIELQAGEYRQLFAAVYLKNPVREAKIGINGENWSLNQLIWRNSASEAEDLCIARKFWMVPGLADFGSRVDVWKVIPDEQADVPVILGKELTDALTVRSAYEGKTAKHADEKMPPVSEEDEDLAWIWNLNMTGLGNAESGFAFTNEAFLRQRLVELKEKGFNAMLEQGLFWHASYSDETFRGLIEHQKRVNAIAHEYGIKIIRHTDGPAFSLMADGLANFARFPGAFGQHLASMQNMQGIGCINNPTLRQWIIKRIGDYVAETNADGIMVDECIIAEREQCGCIHCRRKFQADTGCILPFPGDKSIAFDDKSSLHARFVEWKLRCNADFYRDLKVYINKVRPGTLVTAYDIDRELADAGGRTGYRADFFGRQTDFFGSEPCAINLFVNYRCYQAMRKIMLAFSRETGHPVWTLIYNWGVTDKKQAGLLGWLLATATSHSLWMEREISHPVMAWKGAMDRRNKESMADVAVLYRPDARSFVGYGKYQPYMEAGGISESLSDHHISHDFITQSDLLHAEVLKRYKVLMLGNINVLSDAEIAALKRWIETGGKLLISGTFGGVNEFYAAASQERQNALTGVESTNEFAALASEKLELNGEQLTLPERYVPMVLKEAESVCKLANGQVVLAKRRLGSGEVWTSSLPLGESNFEPLFYYAQRYTYKYNAELSKLAPAFLKAVHPGVFRTAVEGTVPKEQRVEFYRDKKSGAVYVHCINLSGSNRAETGKVPVNAKLPDDAFENAADMTIEVQGKFTSAIATSPDFRDEMALPVIEKGDRTIVKLPGAKLKHYVLITLK